MIIIENLNKEFRLSSDKKISALKNVNLCIKDSEIFGIIGLSGAGKSTLIRTINRLEEPSSGKIEIDNIDITKLSKEGLRKMRKDIGMIFQHFNLLSSRTIYGNIAYPMEIAKKSKSEINRRVKELLTLVGLEDKEAAYPSQLSGGQKQRVAIARALANNPKVLLCDEATSALDPNTTKSILTLLKNINKNLGITIIIITHQMEVIRDVCNRVAIIENGEIIELESVENIFSNPRTQTAKDFIVNVHPNDDIDDFFPKEKDSMVIKISYLKDSAKNPVISKMIKTYNIDVNIISGDINKLMSTSVGHLLIQLIGDSDSMKKSLDYLRHQNLLVEVVWSDRSFIS